MIHKKEKSNITIRNTLYILLSIVIFVFIEKILNNFNVSFRHWVKLVFFAAIVIWTIVTIIYSYIKYERVKIIAKKLKWPCIIATILACIFWRYVLLFGLLFFSSSDLSIREHTVDMPSGKKVVYVKTVWMSTHVEIHEYYNLFFCSYHHDYDYYKGTYDRYDKKHEQQTLAQKEKEKEEREKLLQEQEKTNQEKIYVDATINENDEILYKEKFDNTTIAAVCKGDWSGKHIVQILKSEDDEKSWISMIDTADEAIDVHYGTEFKFYNKNFGYYLDKGLQGYNQNYEFKFTSDGGKHFYTVKLFIAQTEIGDKYYYLEDFPEYKNGEYIMKLKVYINNEEKEYMLYSLDGQTYELK